MQDFQNGAKNLLPITLWILATSSLLGILIIGKSFLTPIVLAVLISVLINAAISRVENLGAPKWFAIFVAAIGICMFVLLIAYSFYSQIDTIAESIPQYKNRISVLMERLSSWIGPSLMAEIEEAVRKIDLGGFISKIADSAGSIMGNIGLIILYVAFLQAERGKLLPKFAKLVTDPEKTPEILSIMRKVSLGVRRYLGIKTVMSLLTGGVSYLILLWLDVDFPEIWAILIFLLNYIPTIGSILGVVFPTLFALVQFDSLWLVFQLVLFLGLTQFTIGNIIEPRFMGQTLNLSPFVVLVSLSLWGAIWGLEGMFLSVPITASTMIICSYIPWLKWIAVLLSSDGEPDKAGEVDKEVSATHEHKRRFFLPGLSNAVLEEVQALRQEVENLKRRDIESQTKNKQVQE